LRLLSKLPLLSWRELIKALRKVGFVVVRQKGSHIMLAKGDRVVPVPRHAQIKRGLLLEIVAEAGLARDEFLRLLR
jgi:predicted RNA binding protein YcfA (HicA-like mRNA interferase family)